MRRFEAAVTIAILASAAALAEAQTPVRPVPAVLITPIAEPVALRRIDPKAIVDRVLSFDADGDERVSADELPERMKAALDRADQNNDGFLTASEVVLTRPTGPVTAGTAIRLNRSSLTDVVDDLKLAPAIRDRAMAIVTKHRAPRRVDDPDSIDLHAAMRDLLDEEDYGNFAAAVARLRFGSFTVRTVVRPGADVAPPTP